MAQPNYSTLLEKIENMRCDVAEVKVIIEKLRDERITDAVQHNDSRLRITSLENRMTSISSELLTTVRTVQDLSFQSRIVAWTAGVIGASMIGLIWSVILGRATIIFP